MWKPNIEDWEKISHEAYAFMFEQSKLRFEDIMQESEKITSRAIKLLSVVIGFLTALATASIKYPLNTWVLIIAGILYIGDVGCLCYLLLGKKIVTRGSSPKEIFKDNMDRADYEEKDQLSMLYYNELRRYQDRIEHNTNVNYKRQKIYFITLFLSVILISTTSAIIVITITRP